MIEINNSEKKKISLEIFTDIDRFCKENGIRYFLAYGSLLGAVRHSGFIPWDDDIDLIMFYPDYMRFISLYNEACNSNFECCSFEQKTFALPFAKVFDRRTKVVANNRCDTESLSLSVDIFPFSYSPEKGRKLRNKKGYFFYKMSRYKLYNSFKEICPVRFSLSKFLFFAYSKLNSSSHLFRRIMKFKNSNQHTKAGAYCKYLFDPKYNVIFNSNWFKETVELVFEGIKCPCPKEFDSVLRAYYGDYMVIPEEKNRINHSAERAFYVDK